jgi:membrane protease YdiL (CAAX protease family)
MLYLFWLLSFAIAWALTVPTALAQLGYIDSSPVPAGLGNLIGFAPAIAAFIAAAASGDLRRLASRFFRLRAPISSYFLAIGLPVAWLVGATVLRDRFGAAPVEASFDPSLLMFAALWLVLAFGEEIGWRGYALPILNLRHGFWKGATILGVVWALWHYPKLLSSPFIDSLAHAVPLIGMFTLQIILANYVLCWLFLRSNLSVVIAALFHAAFNVIATAYPQAGVDPYLTACVALCVLLILLFERGIEVDEDA